MLPFTQEKVYWIYFQMSPCSYSFILGHISKAPTYNKGPCIWHVCPWSSYNEGFWSFCCKIVEAIVLNSKHSNFKHGIHFATCHKVKLLNILKHCSVNVGKSVGKNRVSTTLWNTKSSFPLLIQFCKWLVSVKFSKYYSIYIGVAILGEGVLVNFFKLC